MNNIVLLTISNLSYKIAIYNNNYVIHSICYSLQKKLGVGSIKSRMRYKMIGIPTIFYDFLIMWNTFWTM